MKPAHAAASWRNPLRDKRDKRLPRIAGPCGMVIFGVTGDLARKKVMPAASRIEGPVRRAVGELKVELVRNSETIVLSRPQEGITATLTRTGKPDALVPLARRVTGECLAEDLRRLDPDEIYCAALEGIKKVQYR